MRRFVVLMALLGSMVPLVGPAPAGGKAAIAVSASPNPVVLGQRVVHSVTVAVSGRLGVWVSSAGFGQPGLGTLPAGSWSQECCPSQTAGTAAWHYRSSSPVPVGSYRFGADARRTGSYLSTASLGFPSSSIWVRVVRD